MIVDITLKLTQDDLIKEQIEDTHTDKVTQLLKNQQTEQICGTRNRFFRNMSILEVQEKSFF